MTTPPSRNKKYKRRPVRLVKIVSHSQKIDKLGEQEMAKGKSRLTEWYDWLTDYVQKPIKLFQKQRTVY